MSVELPKDAEGREIPLDTKTLYTADGTQCDVSHFTYYPKCKITEQSWHIVFEGDLIKCASRMYLNPPDSWEKLEEDLGRGADALNYEACAYFGKSACDCSSCVADKGETCERVAMHDIADRICKLRGEGDA